MIGTVVLSSSLWRAPEHRCLAGPVQHGLSALGFADDYWKVTKKKSDGISGRFNPFLFFNWSAAIVTAVLTNPLIESGPVALSACFIFWLSRIWAGSLSSSLSFVIVGSSNAVNLTDGLDGLAIGRTITAAFVYALLAHAAGNFCIAEHPPSPVLPPTGELAVVCWCWSGLVLVSLLNCHPAKMIMGDTGVLAIGGVIGVIAICCKQELLLAWAWCFRH